VAWAGNSTNVCWQSLICFWSWFCFWSLAHMQKSHKFWVGVRLILVLRIFFSIVVRKYPVTQLAAVVPSASLSFYYVLLYFSFGPFAASAPMAFAFLRYLQAFVVLAFKLHVSAHKSLSWKCLLHWTQNTHSHTLAHTHTRTHTCWDTRLSYELW